MYFHVDLHFSVSLPAQQSIQWCFPPVQYADWLNDDLRTVTDMADHGYKRADEATITTLLTIAHDLPASATALLSPASSSWEGSPVSPMCSVLRESTSTICQQWICTFIKTVKDELSWSMRSTFVRTALQSMHIHTFHTLELWENDTRNDN